MSVKLRVLLAVIIVGVVVVFFSGIKFGSDPVPNRPPNVPATARYVAGRELSSVWVNIGSVEPDSFTADTYFENGEIWYSDRFIAPANRLKEPLTIEWLNKRPIFPDGRGMFVIDDNDKEIYFKGTKPLPPL
jgi:hypothetical protein